MPPNVIAVLSCLIAIIIFVKRKYLPIPLLLTVCFLPYDIVLEIGPLHFAYLRIIIIAIFIRMLFSHAESIFSFSRIDRLFVLWLVVSTTIGIILEGAEGLVGRLGNALDTFGTFYILVRSIEQIDDIDRINVILIICLIPIALSMIAEHVLKMNPYSYISTSTPEVIVRNGSIRCRAAFAHPILAGTFASTFFPIILGYSKNKVLLISGIVSCLSIIALTASSGPIMSLVFSCVGVYLWKFRGYMSMIRRVFVVCLIACHLVMKAPIWFLLARVDLTGSSTGWHRAELIDSFFRHFSEWWLIGTTYTRHWMPTGVTWSPKHTDITNHYILQAVNGGLLSLILFIAIIVICFKTIGDIIRIMEYLAIDSRQQFAVWCLGAVLFSHTVTFISVAYFDQTVIYFYLLIAGISTYSKFYHKTVEQAALVVPQ